MSVGAPSRSSSRVWPSGLLPAVGLACLAGCALAAATGGVRAIGPSLLALAVLVVFLVVKLPGHYPHRRFGWCNAVTLLRAALVAVLFGLLWAAAHGWPVLAIAAVGLALDGLDGWLARRERLVSGFGARFDMETDAALALILAAHAWLAGMTGAEILILGVMRYVFVLAFLPCPWLAAPLPERFGRKLVCVVQIAALILLQVPTLPPTAAALIAWPAVAALLWSFGRDTLWLWRNRE